MNIPSQKLPKVRLLIIDVDGTLLGADRTISQPVRGALRRARLQGVQVALCTGRPLFTTRHLIEALQITGGHVFNSGASVVDTSTGVLLHHQGIDKALAHRFLEETHRQSLHIEIYAGDHYYIETEREHSRIHTEVLQFSPQIRSLAEVIEREPITKMELVALDGGERARIHALAAQFADLLDTGWAGAPGTSADFINVLAKGVSKGAAAAHLAGYYSIPAAQVIAVGDGLNDEPLLRFAGIGVAMGNAPEALKRAATWIAPSIEDDGLASAIDRYVLAQEDISTANLS